MEEFCLIFLSFLLGKIDLKLIYYGPSQALTADTQGNAPLWIRVWEPPRPD